MSRFPAFILAALLVTASVAAAQNGPISSQPLPPPSVLGTPVPVVKPPPGTKPHKPSHAAHPLAAVAPKPAARAKPPPSKTPAPKAAIPKVAPAGTEPPVAAPPARPDPTKGATTGLKLPRWVAFRSDEVNLRTGPGMQYPIDWQYHRRDLPVRVLREYEVWRLVETQDGTKGWVHQATLTGRRGFLVVDPEKVLRATPDDVAAPVARLEPGVVGHIRSCDADKAWCEVQTGDYRGWLKRTDLWGVDPDEVIN